MRNKENKHFGLEIESDIHYKLHYISKYYDRSVNAEVIHIIRKAVKKYEDANGEISVPSEIKKKKDEIL